MTKFKSFTLLLLSAGIAFSQPLISAGGIVHAADNSQLSGIPQGALMTIYGQRLGSQAAAASLPLGTTLGGAQVRVRAPNGTNYDAYLIFVSPGQINALLPSTVPIGGATVTVINGTQTSNALAISVRTARLGIFSLNSAGSGPGIVQNYESPTQVPLNLRAGPARAGQTLIVWGTGLGAYRQGADNIAPLPGNIGGGVEVIVGGKSVAAAYAGRAPGFPGVDQINFAVPAGLPNTCLLPVQVKVGTELSNVVTIAKSDDGPCPFAFGYSDEQKSALALGAIPKTALLEIGRGLVIGQIAITKSDTVALSLSAHTTSSLATWIPSTFILPEPNSPVRACAVESRVYVGTATVIGDTGDFTDTGAFLHTFGEVAIRGSAGQGTYTPGRASNWGKLGNSFEVPGMGIPPIVSGQLVWDAGSATFSFPASSKLAAFTATVNVPAHMQPPASFELFRDKSAPLTLTWTPGDSTDADRVLVGLVPGKNVPVGNSTEMVFCVAKRNDGQITIPGDLIARTNPEANFPSFAFVQGYRYIPATASGGGLDAILARVTNSVQYAITFR